MKTAKNKNVITIGSRQSDLARLQAITVGELLKSKFPEIEIKYFNRPSFGDLNLDMNLKETNSKGVFTQEFKDLLKNGDCDLVVHSWKDLPIESDVFSEIMTLSDREDQRDLLFIKKTSLNRFPFYESKTSDFGSYNESLVFLTSSPRREYSLNKSLKSLLPFKVDNLKFESIRGNIPTRFSKFLNSKADGFVVAKAAVDRLMSTENLACADEFKLIREQILEVFDQCRFMVLPLSEFPTAAAQGALALEILKNHPFKENLAKISDPINFELVELERQTHKQYGGGCHQAMGFSALKTDRGTVFYSSGEFKDHSFKTGKLIPNKKLDSVFKTNQLFSQSSLKSERQKNNLSLKDIDPDLKLNPRTEFVVTRYEARVNDLKNDNFVVWASGTKTWEKLAQDGYWVCGSLDGLGVGHKPQLSYLKMTDRVWLTNRSSLTVSEGEVTGSFKMLSTYELQYNLETNKKQLLQDLKNKECFYWMSGHGFESVLKILPGLKDKIHFCGLGRTVDTLKKHLNEDQIYFCLNEEDFINKCTKNEG